MKNIVENQGIKNDKPLALTYEQLKAQLDAVVAECVLAKAEVVCWAKECDRIVYRHTNQITDMHQLEAVKDLANLTPNVTASLAEVEAKAIEKFVTKIAERLRMAGGEDGYSLVNWGEYADHLEDKGEEFAAELREGRV
ncbi:hypothetical protein [Serratia fonticola]|uniref:hypothetical protein n=1 Tax=Serratia fonticola TaxID=47917 RepID=UPI00217993B9|nr:hypothetical protein [Serratia fonticola]CAI1037384.1 Uncharacterised protein [Serratia fonticola]